jgi:hypothetical protein
VHSRRRIGQHRDSAAEEAMNQTEQTIPMPVEEYSFPIFSVIGRRSEAFFTHLGKYVSLLWWIVRNL